MTWEKILELVKLLGPFALELLKIIFKSPSQATENLKTRGLIKDR
jgi:hypothetical protein